jgi:hypothetical protein
LTGLPWRDVIQPAEERKPELQVLGLTIEEMETW